MPKLLYQTNRGKCFVGDSKKILESEVGDELRNKVQLIFTSPPFPLITKKRYGNLNGEIYKKWLIDFSDVFSDLLKEDGSIVIELGNAWEMGRPVQSLLSLEALLGFINNSKSNLRLCQEFICYNPSRLPSPAQWVTIERIRAVDSFTHLWWMSNSDYPKADNKKVLRPYGKRMKQILGSKKCNAGKRPSAHNINGKSFMTDNLGSIMPNLIEIEPIEPDRDVRLPTNVFCIANTQSNDFFLNTCRKEGIIPHPARMPLELANFFINFLTDPDDIILDPFAGSNTTGFCAEKLRRKWVSIEIDEDLGKQSIIRFQDPSLDGDFYVYL